MIPEPITREEKFLKEIYDAASGGGGSVEPLIVALEDTVDREFTADKTNGEILEAIQSGRPAWIVAERGGTELSGAIAVANVNPETNEVRLEAYLSNGEKRYWFSTGLALFGDSGWVAREVSPLYVELSEDGSYFTADATNEQIADRVVSGAGAFIKMRDDSSVNYLQITTVRNIGDDGALLLGISIDPTQGALMAAYTTSYAADNTTWAIATIPLAGS